MMQMNLPPFAKSSETSRKAAISMHHETPSLRVKVYGLLLTFGGMTAEEIQTAMNTSGSTIRPRIWELRKEGRVVDSGETRPTRSGRQATIWRVK